MATQLQVKKSRDKEQENKIICKYCGRILAKEEILSHNCRTSPD